MPEFRVVFTAEDYDTTVPFFTDVMGLEVLRSWDDHGRGTILLAADGQIVLSSCIRSDAVKPTRMCR